MGWDQIIHEQRRSLWKIKLLKLSVVNRRQPKSGETDNKRNTKITHIRVQIYKTWEVLGHIFVAPWQSMD